ncbi:MAG: Unknown protein [uncultured Aureispira sp.]|uniref:Uncharacterized protein n=1 Tax=uncultured Aureispira sp. TaxID=1331704 RepID=A0A6S6U8H6_9BACT|nr:MAG: Unknown protein [uncultured Aureispira sp.]
MKKIILLGAIVVFILINYVGSVEPVQAISEVEKMEILRFETATKIEEAKREEIELSTKELQELLKEL